MAQRQMGRARTVRAFNPCLAEGRVRVGRKISLGWMETQAGQPRSWIVLAGENERAIRTRAIQQGFQKGGWAEAGAARARGSLAGEFPDGKNVPGWDLVNGT